MEWQTVNFDWNRAKAFLVAAEEGSFSAAARALGVTQPTVGRQVTALEEELGVTLLERVAHGIELTPTGLEVVEHFRAMSEAAARVSLVAAGQSVSLEGTVSISASEVISTHLLPPIIRAIRVDYPGIEIDIVASNLASDLRRREADIAVRNFQPQDPELVARKVKESRAWLYASPAYLEELGHPTSPEDLSNGEFIGFDRTDALMEGLNALGLDLTGRSFPIITESQLVQWELCKQGAGICVMMEEVGDAEPRVQKALPDLPPFPVPMWLVSHREVRMSRRVRVVFDALADGLS
ncbi:LysR family transcriptional regulator [Persicimonas caeni]|uniref:LysR family transcriptional regulator n=2 Tax=Persicimonas caeni TaxID=2292766 RepID=A0A4Y6Q2Z2_PERCE|nr:LysR family transcriptional regulator [Persicimonas caeni]QED36183.1 LysR family transcriptional regulator [Persicimonas caeni]